MSRTVKLQFSCELFWGFQFEITIDEFTSLDEIINVAVVSLDSFLQENNFQTLLEKRREISYNIHGEILMEPDNNGIHGYICGHENTCHNHLH